MNPIKKHDTKIFQEEIEKRISVPEGQFEKFLELWEFKKFSRNEFILKSNEIPKFSIFVLFFWIKVNKLTFCKLRLTIFY